MPDERDLILKFVRDDDVLSVWFVLFNKDVLFSAETENNMFCTI